VSKAAAVGATRACPHCKATILESSSVCPACKGHLRFDAGASARTPNMQPLRVEASLRHPPGGSTWEYSMVLTIRNEEGKEVARQLVGVGALQPNEQRTFTLSVDVFAPDKAG
jgi:hypothetical protein